MDYACYVYTGDTSYTYASCFHIVVVICIYCPACDVFYIFRFPF